MFSGVSRRCGSAFNRTKKSRRVHVRFFFIFSSFFGGHPTNSSLTIFQFIPCSFPAKLIDDRRRTRSPRTRRYRTKITSLPGNDAATEELVTSDFRWFRPPSKIHSAIAPRKSELALQFICNRNVFFFRLDQQSIRIKNYPIKNSTRYLYA